MKPRPLSLLSALLLSAFLAAPMLAADAPAPAPAKPAPRPFQIVVSEAIDQHAGSAYETYNRVARVFPAEFERRKWPVKITVERFGANTPECDLELSVFLQPIRRDTPFDLTFRAWMILKVHGKKHDFGIVRYSYDPRPGQQMDDQLDAVIRGAAAVVAAKIEPILFPELVPAPKP